MVMVSFRLSTSTASRWMSSTTRSAACVSAIAFVMSRESTPSTG